MATERNDRRWDHFTTEEIAVLDKERLVVVVPVAATEQHGPHLPLSTDSDIAEILLDAGLAKLAEDAPVYRLPLLPFGLSPEHAAFPGTISLAAETLTDMLVEIGESLAAAGVRKIAFFNTHGGQPQILDLAAQQLREHFEVLAFTLNGYRYWRAGEHFPEAEAAHGIHGGAAETSILMHAMPEKVRIGKLTRFESLSERMAAEFTHLRPFGRIVGFGWQAEDLNPAGAVGDPTLATAEAGGALIDQAARTLSEILSEIVELSPDILAR
jgi:creatinine amidohydrolase